MSKKKLHALHERLRAHGSRIEALVPDSARPAASTPGGYSAQIASLQHLHRTANARFIRLASTPESEADWQRLHDQLESALQSMDDGLGALETHQGSRH